jgi:hypothetical protein
MTGNSEVARPQIVVDIRPSRNLFEPDIMPRAAFACHIGQKPACTKASRKLACHFKPKQLKLALMLGAPPMNPFFYGEEAGAKGRSTAHSFTRLSLSALLITDTELKLIAAAAKIGLSRMPNLGYRMPAAIGTPSEL